MKRTIIHWPLSNMSANVISSNFEETVESPSLRKLERAWISDVTVEHSYQFLAAYLWISITKYKYR